MKKFKRFLTLALALSLAMGVTAFAATTIDSITISEKVDGNAKVSVYESEVAFDLTYTAGVPDNMYLILVLKEGAEDKDNFPVVDDILYVNQATADKDGIVVFENVYPSVIANGSIYMAGSGMELTDLGTIIANLPDFVIGDVDQNGTINIVDLQRLFAHLNNSNPLTDTLSGDVDQSGGVNIVDLQRLFAHLNGSNPLQ